MKNENLTMYFSIFKFAYHRDSGMGKAIHITLFLTMLSGLIFAWKVPEYARTGYLLSMVAFAGFFIGYWLVFCIGFLLQNSPANACTVPHLHQKIQRLAMLLCVTISLIFSTFSGYLFGHFSLMFAFSLATLATFWAYNIYYYALFFSVIASMKWSIPFALENEASVYLSLAEIGMAACYAWLCLQSSFPRGGDRHIKIFKSLGHLLQQATPNDNANTTWQKFDKLQAIFTFFYRRELNKINRTTTNSPRQLMHIGLGPGMHWGVDLLMAGLALIYSVLLALGDSKQDREFFLGFLLLFVPIASSTTLALSCLAQLHKTRREQALLCLAPIIPQTCSRNHMLRSLLLRRFVQNWLMSTTCVGLLLLAGMALELTGYGIWLLAWSLSSLLFAFVLQDYSELDADPRNGMRVVAVATLIIAACFSVKWGEGAFLYFSISTIVLLVILAAYRGMQGWRRMLTYPLQMPVGHRR